MRVVRRQPSPGLRAGQVFRLHWGWGTGPFCSQTSYQTWPPDWVMDLALDLPRERRGRRNHLTEGFKDFESNTHFLDGEF